MSMLSIGKAWDEAKAALQANRKLIVPVALGLVLLPAVIVSMVEPQVPPGEQPPPGSWMFVALAMVVVMIVGQLAIVIMVNGWRGSVGEAIAQAARRAPTFILAVLGYLLPVIVISSIMLAILGVGTTDAGQVDWANFSGAGFSDMRFKFLGMSNADFERWVSKAKGEGTVLSRNDYLRLERPSEREPVRRFSTVARDLFDAVANRCVEQGKTCLRDMMPMEMHRASRSPSLRDPGAWNPFGAAAICTADNAARSALLPNTYLD